MLGFFLPDINKQGMKKQDIKKPDRKDKIQVND